MLDDLPEPLRQSVFSTAFTFILAWLGRLMWHVREVQKQRRRFWSLHLVWELLTALAISFVADGVVDWLGFDGKAGLGLVVVIAYLGPRGIENLILSWLKSQQRSGRKV